MKNAGFNFCSKASMIAIELLYT